jgi:hypothetical protein
MTDETLSDKIDEVKFYEYNNDFYYEEAIKVKDVREAVLKLKKKGSLSMKYTKFSDEEEEEIRECLNNKIDSIFGERLSK